MKLPKCPHCEKLMIAVLMEAAGSYFSYKEAAIYLCPEKLKKQEPDWVEVLEV